MELKFLRSLTELSAYQERYPSKCGKLHKTEKMAGEQMLSLTDTFLSIVL
jgi:hypothetical protein